MIVLVPDHCLVFLINELLNQRSLYKCVCVTMVKPQTSVWP